jgi:hypothetical protein
MPSLRGIGVHALRAGLPGWCSRAPRWCFEAACQGRRCLAGRTNPPRAVAAGDALHFGCTFVNNSSQVLTFGESAATSEMCVFASAFVPGADHRRASARRATCALGPLRGRFAGLARRHRYAPRRAARADRRPERGAWQRRAAEAPSRRRTAPAPSRQRGVRVGVVRRRHGALRSKVRAAIAMGARRHDHPPRRRTLLVGAHHHIDERQHRPADDPRVAR